MAEHVGLSEERKLRRSTAACFVEEGQRACESGGRRAVERVRASRDAFSEPAGRIYSPNVAECAARAACIRPGVHSRLFPFVGPSHEDSNIGTEKKGDICRSDAVLDSNEAGSADPPKAIQPAKGKSQRFHPPSHDVGHNDEIRALPHFQQEVHEESLVERLPALEGCPGAIVECIGKTLVTPNSGCRDHQTPTGSAQGIEVALSTGSRGIGAKQFHAAMIACGRVA